VFICARAARRDHSPPAPAVLGQPFFVLAFWWYGSLGSCVRRNKKNFVFGPVIREHDLWQTRCLCYSKLLTLRQYLLTYY
jgi:hypothetical protein